jgi:hypothetical protein
MVNRCVLFGCSETSSKVLKISIHAFPKDPKFKRLWIKFVKTTRDNWEYPTDENGNDKDCFLCSLHFTPDCFETNEVAASLGYESK